MANQGDYFGSIAQNYITFATTYEVSVTPGQNFQNIMVFVGSGEAVATSSTTGKYFVASGIPSVGTIYTLNGNNYSSTVSGPLEAWLTEFYNSNNSLSNAYVVIYDDSGTTDGSTFDTTGYTALKTQYDLYKMYAYFKVISYQTKAAKIALAKACQGDSGLLSQAWMTETDATVLSGGLTTLDVTCKANGYDPVIIFTERTLTVNSGTVADSAALSQLGLSLGYLNATGTSVGNSLDMLSTSYEVSSGPNGSSLSATDMTTLNTKNVGFFLYVGDTTGNVAVRGGVSVLGTSAAARWMTAYIDYMCKVKTATYLTGHNHFRNNETYQAILSYVSYYLALFTSVGRLTGASITAGTWDSVKNLSSGDVIIVPNAWQATYQDNVREVTVNGTLYISE